MTIKTEHTVTFEPDDFDTLLRICRLARWHLNDTCGKHSAEPDVFPRNPPGFNDDQVEAVVEMTDQVFQVSEEGESMSGEGEQ